MLLPSERRADQICVSLPGRRAHDILRGVDLLCSREDVDPGSIRAAGQGVKGIWPLVAAAADLRIRKAQPLWLLFAATGVLLGLACLNVAGLSLARGSARGREIGTRVALGASRGRIGRQLLADSLLLSVAGGVLGAVVAPLAIRGLIAFLPHELAANALRGTLSFRLLTFAFFATLG